MQWRARNDPEAAVAAPRHTWLDDTQALVTGTLFVALGVLLFRHAGLVTGGTVGIAFVLHYASAWPFGALLFAVNAPFFVLAWRRLGPRFVGRTFAAVALLSVLSEAMPHWIALQQVQPWFAALGGGLLVGAGLLILFRHHASLGGINVLVVWLQDRYGWSAGRLQMAIDVAILLAAMPWVDAEHLALSVVGAVALNFALAVNHKPGRYVAV